MKLTFVEDKEYDSQFAESLEEREGLDIAYDRDVEPIARAIEGYQKSWDSINDDFSRYVEDVTGHPWAHEEYECVVSPVHQGISNWNGSKRIVRWCKDDPLKMRHITAHELILHHYFVIVRTSFADAGLSDKQIWALAETAAFALTSLTPEAKNFWPWDKQGYYTNHNYPEIVELQKKLERPFVERKSFDEYVRAGIEVVINNQF